MAHEHNRLMSTVRINVQYLVTHCSHFHWANCIWYVCVFGPTFDCHPEKNTIL